MIKLVSHGYVGCICKGCGWKRKVRKAHEMVEYLTLTCTNVTGEVKDFFIQELRERTKIKTSNSNNNKPNDQEVNTKKKENYH